MKVVILALLLAVQGPLAFDVVSVKRAPPGGRGGGVQMPPGQFVARNYAIRALIVLAYGVRGYQVRDLPGWAESERYDIVARMPAGDFNAAQRGEMIRAMLVDRFKLTTHREMREIPSYTLVLARNDQKLGSALTRTAVDCNAVRARRAAAGPPARPPTPEEILECSFLSSNRPDGSQRLRVQGLPMSDIVAVIANFVDRPVFDGTGLAGGFDLDLTFQRPTPAPQSDAASIFTAVQDQLGLTLEPTRTAVDALVVDGIERPTEN